MSVIFGLASFDQVPVASEALESMNAALALHGPDDGGVWVGGTVGLGHRLLRTTPQDAFERQPLTGVAGQVALVFAGRLDDRANLAKQLNLAAQQAEVLPDSTLLLCAYERWGAECVHHLVGAFTFAVWDGREACLRVARSPIASPSLFYHGLPRGLAFATMPKGLFALPYISRELDEAYLADYLALERTELRASFYRGIRRLLPGEMLTVRREGWEVAPYWQPAEVREVRFARDEDYVDAFSELLERVVGDHLRSLTPVGVMMSGGLDSTTVAAVAAGQLQRCGGRLATFTEVPRPGFGGPIIPGRYADETPYVQAMAHRFPNLDVHLIHTDGRVYIEDLAPFFQAAEVPFRNASNRVWYEAILRAAQESGQRVLLDGAQGNLTISWTGDGLLAQWVRAGYWRRAWREAGAMARQAGLRHGAGVLINRGVFPLLPDALYAGVELLRPATGTSGTGRQAYSPIHPDFARAQHVDERARERQSHFRFRLTADTRTRRAQIILATTVHGDGLDGGYQAMFGVTNRQPAADVRLFEFCLALPEEQYQHEGRTRWLLHRAMAQRLPPEVLDNPRRGLQAADWFERLTGAREASLQVLDRVAQSDLARRAIDWPRLRQLVETMPHAAGDATQLMADYRGLLELGLMTGCFIRWVETGQV